MVLYLQNEKFLWKLERALSAMVCLGALMLMSAHMAFGAHMMKNCTKLPHSPSGLSHARRQFFGTRHAENFNFKNAEDCDAGFCVGPGYCYPTDENIDWYAEFDVPPLPTTFEPSQMTDYIYFNIFFGYGNDHDNPDYPACMPQCNGDGHGRFNQFVPQLMLGSALCNSTNDKPDPSTGDLYHPIWCHLSKWAISAQYFFASYAPGCTNHSSACGFKAYAATGDLIYVEPGETVYVRFTKSSAWELKIGVKGDRVAPSVVKATQPYMGQIPTATSWDAPQYNRVYAGSCWELYGNSRKTDYPPYMHYRHTLTAPKPESFWHAWGMDEGNSTNNCRTTKISSSISSNNTSQIVTVNATMLLE